MASNVVVIDSSFRRHTVKVNPGKYMTEVLEEACKKFSLNPNNYGLKNKDKPVDLSRTYRQTGLVSGAKLELVQASRTPSAVSVALQLPESLATSVPGGRLVDKLPSDTTLWRILRHLESKEGLNLNFTARGAAQIENGASSGAGRIFYEMPALNIMGRECSTFGDLQKTLAQLGINGGSTLIRLSFKKTEQPLEEAINEIRQYFKEEEAPAKVTPPKDVDTITNALERLPSSEPDSKDVDMAGTSEATTTDTSETTSAVTPSKRPAEASPSQSPEETQILGPGQRPISVYRPPSSHVPLAATKPHNEADYEPTVAHAKLHQSRLKNSSENKRLLSDAEAERLESERAAKLAATTEVSIKIRFPDQTSMIATFKAPDTGANLHSFVRAVIVADDQPFKLVWNGKGVQTVPDNERLLIKDLGFERSVLVNFVWEDDARESVRRQAILKPEWAEKAREVSVPEIEGVDAGEEDRTPVVKQEEKGKDSGKEGKAKGVPKWLKLGNK